MYAIRSYYALKHLRIGRKQLPLWVKGTAKTANLKASWREEAFYQWLLEKDENFRNIIQLPDDLFPRERMFFGNTHRGIV